MPVMLMAVSWPATALASPWTLSRSVPASPKKATMPSMSSTLPSALPTLEAVVAVAAVDIEALVGVGRGDGRAVVAGAEAEAQGHAAVGDVVDTPAAEQPGDRCRRRCLGCCCRRPSAT
jgi:hypothetical protein